MALMNNMFITLYHMYQHPRPVAAMYKRSIDLYSTIDLYYKPVTGIEADGAS